MGNFRFRAEEKKVTSRAEPKILQLELWLEPARLGLITTEYPSVQSNSVVLDQVGGTSRFISASHQRPKNAALELGIQIQAKYIYIYTRTVRSLSLFSFDTFDSFLTGLSRN